MDANSTEPKIQTEQQNNTDSIFRLLKYWYRDKDDLKEILTFNPDPIRSYCEEYLKSQNPEKLIEEV